MLSVDHLNIDGLPFPVKCVRKSGSTLGREVTSRCVCVWVYVWSCVKVWVKNESECIRMTEWVWHCVRARTWVWVWMKLWVIKKRSKFNYTQTCLFATEVTETAKKLSTLSAHKTMLTLIYRQLSDQGRAAHEHFRSVCLRSFVLYTPAHCGNMVGCSAVQFHACSTVFLALNI